MLEYDVVIVGAGIQGSGVAQALSHHGLKVLVVENTGVAAGTSSQSSKLIHGGLRYLESGQFRLVREALHERDLLLKLAPDLVQLVPFYIPIYRNSIRHAWQIHCGLQLYRWLDGLGENSVFSKVPKSQWQQLDGLQTENLQAVFRYYDAQTDDAALTLAVLNSAREMGADIALPADIEDIKLGEDGCELRVSSIAAKVYAKTLINCTGPWAADFQNRFLPELPHLKIELVQGTHLLIDDHLEQGIYYLESPEDGRAVFAMPWQGKLLLGTTETAYNGHPEQVHPLPEEIQYLRNTLNHYFPKRPNAKVIRKYCGLRVLPNEQSSIFTRSRETLIHTDRRQQPRVLTLIGGKLTTYRATAEKVCDILAGRFGINPGETHTDRIAILPVTCPEQRL
ncbi:FAD-dependent oxidoreductase [Maricurvus nonylphenolicus]|uniref:glycerol-3-phosphate dehydrogenase/oxidase n=1 Tax=Maricurvus nonylphenolicus TaxID=1008307 RepID=UPI0036F3F1D5